IPHSWIFSPWCWEGLFRRFEKGRQVFDTFLSSSHVWTRRPGRRPSLPRSWSPCRFTTVLSASANREVFIDSVASLLKTHDFGGLDLFFLYPGLRGSPMYDRWTFLFLIEELLVAFRKEARLTIRPRLLLSAAVSGDPDIVQTAYDACRLGRLLDFISVLSCDLHGSWEKITGHNSPLFSLPGDSKSLAYAMNSWRKLGAPPEKLLMGLPTYGHPFRLLRASKTGLQAEAVEPAFPGKYIKQAGFLAYYEICYFVQKVKKHWIDYQYIPYAYKGKEWVGYDDAISFSYKALFIKREHFGGAIVWTLDLDDVRGTFYGVGPFPLVYVLNNLLVQAEFSSTPSPKFWLSSAMNSSGTDSERLTVTKALTTDLGILSPREEKPKLCWWEKLGKVLVFSSRSPDRSCLCPAIHKPFVGQSMPQSHSELITFLLNKLKTQESI
ncbi:oviduct-specific glycoprotein, partial [Equus asinus]|uniref:oviduct-specific glycoprotein n=1 Tax=Equus asinus TaxID=9793 RepID=UPI0038F779DD